MILAKRPLISFALTCGLIAVASAKDPPAKYPAAAEVKASFLKLLDRPKVDLDVQADPPQPEADGLVREHLTFASEKKADGTLERVPLSLVRPVENKTRRACVICLHGTGGNKEAVKSYLVDLAKRGIIGVAIDARYHGERVPGSKGADAYNAAIAKAWRAKPGEPQEHPFYYDTCWDLWRTLDYLQTRADVDPARLGMFGISMGGIQTWLAAAVDERVKVAVPAIAAQSYRWSLKNGQWKARANTIKLAHETAAKDLGESEVNERVCRELWDKVVPGILDRYDCPSMLRLFAPNRALLLLNGELDANCPLPGAKLAFASAEAAYQAAGHGERLEIMVAEGVPHRVTDEHRAAALAWLEKWLN